MGASYRKSRRRKVLRGGSDVPYLAKVIGLIILILGGLGVGLVRIGPDSELRQPAKGRGGS